jgi:uncharacterized tellurite resistance protein B-like protein
MMFEHLKKFFASDTENDSPSMTMEMAAAALLVEVSKSDYEQDPAEVDKIRGLLVRHFSVSENEVEKAVAQAQDTTQDSTSLYPFTRYINDNCDNQEKYQLVLSLWEVAAEDGRIDKYEEHLIRKISDLIYLPHREFIRAKLITTEKLENME